MYLNVQYISKLFHLGWKLNWEFELVSTVMLVLIVWYLIPSDIHKGSDT